ncbi:EVE domain-containing protein [bacterium]|nr:EVE domain-containing protein [Candidatus Elulimicrobium humile]
MKSFFYNYINYFHVSPIKVTPCLRCISSYSPKDKLMSNIFLAKTEPNTFSIDDFEKEKITLWDGVHNYQAINVIKTWQVGDYVLIYHSVKEKCLVGLAQVIKEPYHNLADTRFSWAARLKLIYKFQPSERINLATIKKTNLFQNFLLVTNSRLSVMPCPDNFVNWLQDQIPKLQELLSNQI